MANPEMVQSGRRLLGLLTAEVETLAAMARQLDAEMCSGPGAITSSESIETFQQVDYLKQHLQDIAVILAEVTDQAPASWTTNVGPMRAEVQLDRLRQALVGTDVSERSRACSGDVTLF